MGTKVRFVLILTLASLARAVLTLDLQIKTNVTASRTFTPRNNHVDFVQVN